MSRRAAVAFSLLVLAVCHAGAATLQVQVKDAAGKPLADTVVYAISGAPFDARKPRAPVAVEQVDREFVPYVTVIQAGTTVTFPNRDPILHHVYSFSPAKKFELPLYIGTPAAPVVFDKPGPVALGCNIHDWMVAYIYVVATPHFAKTTADGKAHLEGLPAGPYEARVWHPRLRGEAMTKPITLADDEEGHITFALSLKPESRPAPRREPYEGPQQSG